MDTNQVRYNVLVIIPCISSHSCSSQLRPFFSSSQLEFFVSFFSLPRLATGTFRPSPLVLVPKKETRPMKERGVSKGRSDS